MIVKFKICDSFGRVWKHELPDVASWADETSKVDPYTLRVMRDVEGRILAGPMVGEFFDFEVIQ